MMVDPEGRHPACFAFGPMIFMATILMASPAGANRISSPLSFFEGVTETVGTLKIVMRRPAATRSVGRGEIEANGSLNLVQRVEDEGKPPHLRKWLIRQVTPGHFSGSMSEAAGPVTINQIGSRYRFRFKMNGGMSAEQWLTPLPGGRSAATDLTVRRFGIAVANMKAVVRKVS